MPDICFLSGSFSLEYVLGRRCLCDQPPKTPAVPSLYMLLHCTHVITFLLLGAECVLSDLHGRERASGSRYTDSSRLYLFFLYDSAYYVPVINLSHVDNHVLGTGTSSGESPSVGWAWGPQTQPPFL